MRDIRGEKNGCWSNYQKSSPGRHEIKWISFADLPNFHSLSQEVRTPSLKRDCEMRHIRGERTAVSRTPRQASTFSQFPQSISGSQDSIAEERLRNETHQRRKERRLAELPDKLPPFPNFHSLSQEVRTPSLKRDYEMKDTRDASNDSWTNFQKSSQGRHGIQKNIKISELFQRSKLQLFKSFYRKISNVLI